MKHTIHRLIFVSLLAAILAGCAGLGADATPTPENAPAETFAALVSATGVVVPVRYARLSLIDGGLAQEVLVELDQAVTVGQPLVRLQGRESLGAAVTAAKLELTSAQLAMDALSDDPEVRIAAAHAAVVAAQRALDDSQRLLRNLGTPSKQADIDQAQRQPGPGA